MPARPGFCSGKWGSRPRHPRVCRLEDRYYVTWCNGYHGPTIGIAWTNDFETFHQMENAFLPFNRNGVLFPRKIGGGAGAEIARGVGMPSEAERLRIDRRSRR